MKHPAVFAIHGKIIGAFFFLLLGLMAFLGEGKQSPALAVGSVGILGLYGLYPRKTITESRPVTMLFGLFVLFLCISSFFTISPGYTVSEINRYLVGLLVYLFFSEYRSEINPAIFSGFLVRWVGFLLSAAALLIAFPMTQKMIPAMNLLYRVYGHNQISNVLIFALPVVVYNFLRGGRYSFLILAGVLSALIATFSRGAMLLAGLYGAYSLLLLARRKFHQEDNKSTTYILALLFGIFFISTAIVLFSGNALSGRFRFFKEPIFASRSFYWRQAVAAITQKPLTGWGPGSFYLLSKFFQEKPLSYSWFAHSFPLQTAAESGVASAVSLALLICVLVRRSYKNISGQPDVSPVSHALFDGIILILLYSLTDISLDFTVVWMLLWATLGLLAGYDHGLANAYVVRPSFTSIVLVFTGACYVTVMVSGILKLTPYTKLSLLVAPHISDNVVEYLLKAKSPPSPGIEKIITALHGNNPEVLYVLAANEEKTNPLQSLRYYHDALLREPLNTVYAARYIQELSLQKQSVSRASLIGMAAPLFAAHQSYYPGVRHFGVDAIAHSEHKYEVSFIWAIEKAASGSLSYFYPKLYYLWGLREETENPEVAAALLQYAAELSPQWSYFHLELASFYHYVLNDPASAQISLDRCDLFKSAGGHCREFAVETLQEPGYYQEFIVNMQ